mgnify:CR=1 FL=1
MLAGTGVYYLVQWAKPWSRYKKDLALEGPGCVYNLSTLLLAFGFLNPVAFGAYWFTGRGF